MNKSCIFNDNKACSDCGDCDNCIYDNNKICDNCGKCLEEEGVDIRAIKIEEIAKVPQESSKELLKLEESDENNLEDDSETLAYDDNYYEEEEYEDAWDHIEYIDDVQNILDDEIALEEKSEELYPGLIKIKRF